MQLGPNVVIAGRFRLNRLIGQGGMGSVWHATQLGLDVECAIKFIEGEQAYMAESHARFQREAKAAAALHSPHVVQILDHGVCEGTPYIAMELLEGESLGQRLERVPVLPPAETAWIVEQVCRALTRAHALGIVHRDLKPDNIFLVRDDDREIAKVLDFGIAKRTESVGLQTRTGAVLGTPHYMSPEQAQGNKALDFRSDFWSMAIIVFRCVTGQLPFESSGFGDLLMRILVAPLPVPSRVASVPPGFDAWWERAASRDPAGRFQSAKELATSLASALQVSQTVSAVMSVSPVANTIAAPGIVTSPSFVAPPAGLLTGGPVARTLTEANTRPELAPDRRALRLAGAGLGLSFILALGFAFRTRGVPSSLAPSASPPAVSVAAPDPTLVAPPALSPVPLSTPPATTVAHIPTSAIATAPPQTAGAASSTTNVHAPRRDPLPQSEPSSHAPLPLPLPQPVTPGSQTGF